MNEADLVQSADDIQRHLESPDISVDDHHQFLTNQVAEAAFRSGVPLSHRTPQDPRDHQAQVRCQHFRSAPEETGPRTPRRFP